MKLDTILKDYRTLGLVGNANSGKSSLILNHLIELKKDHKGVEIYVFGTEDSLNEVLEKKGINILHNKEDILDLKIENSVIYIDEFADLFSVNSKDKQLERVKRFFNRIYHLNNWFILSTAQGGFWNKFMCGLVKCFFVKEIEYDNLVNGTTLKRKVKGMKSNSDYRFDCPKGEYYVLTDNLTSKESFEYNSEIDSKKKLVNFFEKDEKKDEKIAEQKKMIKKMKDDPYCERHQLEYDTDNCPYCLEEDEIDWIYDREVGK